MFKGQKKVYKELTSGIIYGDINRRKVYWLRRYIMYVIMY